MPQLPFTIAALAPGVPELSGLLAVAAVLSLILFYLQRRSASSSSAHRRMNTFVREHAVAADAAQQRPFGERVVRPILATLARPILRLTPGTVLSSTRERLTHAGIAMGPVEFLGLRFVVASIGLVLGSLAAASEDLPSWLRLLMPFIGVGLGYAMPGVFLSRVVKTRQKRIRRALAPTLEMLSISIEAGLAFDGAIAHVSQRFKNPLSDELRRMFVEFQMGRTRRQALQDFAGRIGVLQVDRFVLTVIQGEAMGVPLSRALQDQALELRNAQRQAAESAARTAPIKMMFPLVLMILPALFIIILGPTVASVLNGLAF